MRAQLSFVLSQITRLTDGQTDGQTERILIARPRLHSMQRGNKTRCSAIAERPRCRGVTVLAKSGRLKLGVNILRTL